ncbi:hypothetical protein [Methanopyrus kandleri]
MFALSVLRSAVWVGLGLFLVLLGSVPLGTCLACSHVQVDPERVTVVYDLGVLPSSQPLLQGARRGVRGYGTWAGSGSPACA